MLYDDFPIEFPFEKLYSVELTFVEKSYTTHQSSTKFAMNVSDLLNNVPVDLLFGTIYTDMLINAERACLEDLDEAEDLERMCSQFWKLWNEYSNCDPENRLDAYERSRSIARAQAEEARIARCLAL